MRVGELARRSGLTVRALHHYEQIGLLQASARSEAGYRLYGAADVTRLHNIQALRALRLPLKDIAAMLAGDGASLPLILARQISELEREIHQASALRDHLALLLLKVGAGEQPPVADWLAALQQMAAYARHFSADEIRRIQQNWPRVADEWAPLMAEVRRLMDLGVPATDVQVQPLANRWMGLIHHWLGGDFDLIDRWARMYQHEPVARQGNGPGLSMVHYMEQVAQRRMAAWLRHFTLAELARFVWVPSGDWQALAEDVAQARAAGLQADAPAAQALAGRWRDLLSRSVGADAALLRQLQAAMAAEPLLRAGALLPVSCQAWLAALADAPGTAGAVAATSAVHQA